MFLVMGMDFVSVVLLVMVMAFVECSRAIAVDLQTIHSLRNGEEEICV
jgi:hypothetical protein